MVSFPALNGAAAATCDPFSLRNYCCSQWGWCGSGDKFCFQAFKERGTNTSVALSALRRWKLAPRSAWQKSLELASSKLGPSSQLETASNVHGRFSKGLKSSGSTTDIGSQQAVKAKRCNEHRWISLHMNASTGATGPDLGRPAGLYKGSIAGPDGRAQVLVTWHHFEKYNTCESDEEISVVRTNLLYFLRTTVRKSDGAHYIISFAGRIPQQLLSLVPPYPNVEVRFAEAKTWSSDLCTHHNILSSFGEELTAQYRYFILINNGMRGPFTGQHSQHQHWTQPFISKLDEQVRLVGPYISCEVSTHVQGPFLVTDRVGVQHVMAAFSQCRSNQWSSIVASEIGSSQKLLAAGHNIASMQHAYEGIDFRENPTTLSCKGKKNPSFCCGADDPLELNWVKYGGEVYRLGLLLPETIRQVEHYTATTLSLTPELGSSDYHKMPLPSWLNKQRQLAASLRPWSLSAYFLTQWTRVKVALHMTV
ncbi:hypothetical protein WJX73_003501 [Symbiochloris irregularis]|uniref:Chitin-binding type-1 domain-containing protein n=1 Tax=Symbiochloris irregularis TaxID=706552 RepID=A0AAW1PF34_9CHLO